MNGDQVGWMLVFLSMIGGGLLGWWSWIQSEKERAERAAELERTEKERAEAEQAAELEKAALAAKLEKERAEAEQAAELEKAALAAKLEEERAERAAELRRIMDSPPEVRFFGLMGLFCEGIGRSFKAHDDKD
jgi:hypothetical protein